MQNEIHNGSSFTIDRSHGDGNSGLCFLIPGNMDAGNIWPTHPPDKSAINQKPQNCRFVHTDERGQKMRGENRRGNYNRKDNRFKYCAVFRIKDE